MFTSLQASLLRKLQRDLKGETPIPSKTGLKIIKYVSTGKSALSHEKSETDLNRLFHLMAVFDSFEIFH